MTYLDLALVFLAVPAALSLTVAFVVRPSRAWWTTTAVTLGALMVLTAVFDSLMVAVDLFRYDESQLRGVFVGKAPLEDFAWPLASALTLPALWELLRRRVGPDTRTPADGYSAEPTREDAP